MKKKLGEELKALPQLQREATIEIRKMDPAELEAKRKARLEARAAGKVDDPEDVADGGVDEEEEDASIVFAFASDVPVERYFGFEILDMDGVDLSRAKDGLPLLDSHDPSQQIGRIENIRVEADGKSRKVIRGDVRFSKAVRAQEIRQDFVDGIRKETSIGYRVRDLVLEKSSETEGDTYRVTDWLLYEGSAVSIPADPTVGASRSEGSELFPVSVRSNTTQTASKPQTTEVRANMDPKVAAEISRLGAAHGIDQERVAKWIEENRSVDSVSSEILSEIAKRGGKPLNNGSAERADQIQLSEREKKSYLLTRGILALVSQEENGKRDNCFELEISQEIERKLPSGYKSRGGLFVPWTMDVDPALAAAGSVRAGLDTKTATKGQEIVFTEPGAFIQFLYNQMLVKKFGAVTLSGLQGNIAFPKQTGKSSGSWVSENPGADVADSNPLLGQITMSPKTYQSSSSYSRQLLAQGVVDVDNLVRQDLSMDSALAFDMAALQGTGAAGQPTGVMNYAGVQAYTLKNDAGNAAQPVWDDIVIMQQMLEDSNADQLGLPAWATTPGIKARLKLTPILGNTTAEPIWAKDGTMDGLTAGQTNQLPKNLTKGTGTNLAPLILGAWNQMICGLWGSGFELVVDPYRLKKQGMIELTTFVMGDVGIRNAPAFILAKYCSK